MTKKLMESELHINWEIICQIIHGDLGKEDMWEIHSTQPQG